VKVLCLGEKEPKAKPQVKNERSAHFLPWAFLFPG